MLQNALTHPGTRSAGATREYDRGVVTLNLTQLPAILYRRRRVVIDTAIVAVLLALAYGFLATPKYVASTRLLIDPRELQVVGDKGLTPRAGSGEPSLAVVESQMRVLTSDNVLTRVIQKLDLLKDSEFAERVGPVAWMRNQLFALLGFEPDPRDPMPLALVEFRKMLRSDRLQNSFIVDLSVTTEDKQKSARIANEIATAYLDLEFNSREALATRTSDSLAGRLSELKERVRIAEDRVERYKQQHNIVVTGDTLFSDQELAQINQQLAQVRTQAAQAQARAAQIERVLRSGLSPDSIAEAVQSQTIAQLRVRLSAVQQQAAGLEAELKPSHPVLIAARARVTDVSNQIRGELDRIARAARADLERARASESDLAATLDRTKQQRATTDQARVELRELEREAEAGRAVYESFLVRAREVGEQKNVDPTNARVVSPAVIPTEPRGPKLSLLLPLAAMLGLGLGGMLAVAKEGLDPSVLNARQVAALTGLDTLAHLPNVKSRVHEVLPAYVVEHPTSAAAAGARSLWATLAIGDRARTPHTVLVTAPGDQQGKTRVSLNLALAAAEAGERVLLIDGDPARRHLTMLRIGAHAGDLAAVLADKKRLEEAIVLDPTRQVSILPASPVDDRPLRPGTAAIERLLIDRCREFDVVIIDGGLVGTDHLTSAFASVVDDIVVVARAGVTRKDDLAPAIAKLGRCRDKVRGVALVEA